MFKNLTTSLAHRLWYYFRALSDIPRPSGEEEAVCAYILKWATQQGVEHYQDNVGNILLKRRGSGPKILVQAHVDMVCQKRPTSNHNFERDPIQWRLDGESRLKACDTTLGADNGAGAAAIMALFENKYENIHLEGLLTIDEERGLTGAQGFDPTRIEADYLLNLDSEEEGEITLGCAGGIDCDARFQATLEDMPPHTTILSLTLDGGLGGHSGVDIDRGRANVIHTLAQLGREILGAVPSVQLISFDGGGIRNAIPRTATLRLAIPDSEVNSMQKLSEVFQKSIQDHHALSDAGLTLSSKVEDSPRHCFDIQSSLNIITGIASVPNGVIEKNTHGSVITSSNIGDVRTQENCVYVRSLQRSAHDSEKRKLASHIGEILKSKGALIEKSGDYPGWSPQPEGVLTKAACECYNSLFDRAAKTVVMHAGLECGILQSKLPGLQAISFGPTIRYPHSPDEEIDIPSTDAFWKFLTGFLQEAPFLLPSR